MQCHLADGLLFLKNMRPSAVDIILTILKFIVVYIVGDASVEKNGLSDGIKKSTLVKLHGKIINPYIYASDFKIEVT